MGAQYDEPKVSSIRYWRFIFPIILLITLVGGLFFIMKMPDTFLTDSSAFPGKPIAFKTK